jgi:hypothetical protein
MVNMTFQDLLPILLARDFGDEALILFGLSRKLWSSDELLTIACSHEIGVEGETRLGRQCRLKGVNIKDRIARTKRLLALPGIDLNKGAARSKMPENPFLAIFGRQSVSLKTPLMNACEILDMRTVKLLLAHSK